MIPSVSIPEGVKGKYKIERKHIKPSPIDVIRILNDGRYVPEGKYTFLYRDNILVMSDTPDEKMDHYAAVKNANGNCLIAGLGIGMVLNAIAKKENVNQIDVVEISQDVIDLVAPHYKSIYGDKINFICSSIFDYVPEKGKYYQMAWFDIWDYLCTDNLEEMSILHKKFSKKAKWKGSWGREYLKIRQKQETNSSWI